MWLTEAAKSVGCLVRGQHVAYCSVNRYCQEVENQILQQERHRKASNTSNNSRNDNEKNRAHNTKMQQTSCFAILSYPNLAL